MGKIDVVFSEKMNEVHERRQREMIKGERERETYGSQIAERDQLW